jgi:hypothetical protein
MQLLLIDGFKEAIVYGPELRTILIRVEIVMQAQLII